MYLSCTETQGQNQSTSALNVKICCSKYFQGRAEFDRPDLTIGGCQVSSAQGQ
jgi:hypothetical protein